MEKIWYILRGSILPHTFPSSWENTQEYNLSHQKPDALKLDLKPWRSYPSQAPPIMSWETWIHPECTSTDLYRMLTLKLKFPSAGAFVFPLAITGDTEGNQMVFTYWIQDRLGLLTYIFSSIRTFNSKRYPSYQNMMK